MRILILGSGPSAAFSVAACKEAGIIPEVRSSQPWNCNMVGANWFWEVPISIIEKMHRNDRFRWIQMFGMYPDDSLYKEAIYGEDSVVTSYPVKPVKQPCYHSQVAFQEMVQGVLVNPPYKNYDTSDIAKFAKEYDLVIQTFSTTYEMHKQPKLIPVYVYSDIVPDMGANMVIYAGKPWLRMTVLWSRAFWEFNKPLKETRRKPTVVYKIPPGASPMLDGIEDNVLRVGRYATWIRKSFAHDAYIEVSGKLRKMLNVR